ncbi:MAG: efflux RND transporter periplasmic adaptor subunit, partial [Gammaproteobacteria bacterium]|nr:efflux RND transporter periplasmic adaptor subunit [Gammaproteobacteria bacterium]
MNTQRQENRLRITLVSIASVGLVAAGLGLIAATVEPYGRIHGEGVAPLVVSTIAAQQQSGYSVAREFVGVVEARRESRVGFELGGLVTELHVDDGDFIEARAVIARLDTALLQARKRELIAERDQARAAKELAELTRTRVGDALKLNAVSSQDWDEADKNYSAQSAALARAESAIRSVDVRLEKAVLRAPFGAWVAERFVDEGQVVEAGHPILHLLESVEPEVRIGVAGAAVDVIRAGQKHELRVRNRRVPATVKTVLPVRGNGSRSVEVIFTLHTEFDGIRRGDLATLEIERSKSEPGFWLPMTALTESSRGLWA